MAVTVSKGTSVSERLDVHKTYKLLINGAFPRSESQRSYPVTSATGELLANCAQASRKDVRDAVVAARAAQPKWASATAYNRGQVLYRLAEMMEARRGELAQAVAATEGLTIDDANAQTARAIDRVVWFAGWTDKLAQVLGGANPVAGPYLNYSAPRPAGVVAVCSATSAVLEQFVEQAIAPLVAGNSVVVLAPESRPIPLLLVAEMSATSDLPGGVLNVLSGRADELAAPMAGHEDVDVIDLGGLAPGLFEEAALLAADTLKRVIGPLPLGDAAALTRLRTSVDITTIWHTIGQ